MHSFDWHPLVVAPFGTRLVDSPIRLHEVLLFHDESLGSADIESKDCYAIEALRRRSSAARPMNT